MTTASLPEIEGCGAGGSEQNVSRTAFLLAYLLLGIAFGVVLTRSEVVSWFRIQEMFRFQSFRMYGIIGSAIATAAATVALIKRVKLKAISGEIIAIPSKELGSGVRYAVGGTIFGLGWALTGACPGPLFALIGNGVSVMIAAVLSALAGTWVYGWSRPRLPH
ncbi:MAG: YeeE/YedE thiosulfate transporter family protein [Terracidiphilus sp.]